MSNHQLANALEELNEDGGNLAFLILAEPKAILKRMPIADKLLLNEDAQPIESPEEGVHDNLCKDQDLRDPVEGIGFFQDHMMALLN